MKKEQNYFTITDDSRRLLTAHIASLSCGLATQLTIATLAHALAYFTTHKSDLETCVWCVDFVPRIGSNYFQRQIDRLFLTEGASQITCTFQVKLYPSLVTHCNF